MYKRLLLLTIVLGLLSCTQQAEKPSESEVVVQPAQIKQDFDWLLGSWIRTNDQGQSKTYEAWKKQSDSQYNGFSCTIQENDTIWQESITLIKTNDTWSYNVLGMEETETTDFQLTSISNGRFVSENQANEFPKKIEYYRNGDGLFAKISGGGTEVAFDFEMIQK